jgi:KUP system potassium uptake protein
VLGSPEQEQKMTRTAARERTEKRPTAWVLLSTLGIVFGDLGTSPLYTMQTVVHAAGEHITPDAALGILSLIVWTLIVTISIKYCLFVMRADNQGEGGIFALMSLVGANGFAKGAKVLTVMGLLGAALIYGDGVITPAISVLSALEGVNVVTDDLKPFVMPAAVAILIVLFGTQRFGTEKIGHAFGPVMVLWFLVIALLGILSIARHPVVLSAVNPAFALEFLVKTGPRSFLVLGGIFLCITGGEALYADMGHFGRTPIRRTWYFIVLPALLLNYAGQTGVLLEKGAAVGNPFFALAPHWAIFPLVGLATLATIIASQAIITGSFSMTRQATQLGWLPGVTIRQTSDEVYGQIYVPVVNWLMMLATVGTTIAFGSSDSLAGAYGTAVSTTMLLTTFLLYTAMRNVWRWPALVALAVGGLFVLIDAGFFSANLLKIADGGWLPLTIAGCLFLVMVTWHSGVEAIRRALPVPPDAAAKFLEELRRGEIPRLSGTTVFLTRSTQKVSRLVMDYAQFAGALPHNVIILSVSFENVPRVSKPSCHVVDKVAERFWHLTASFGFFEIPDLRRALGEAQGLDADVDREKVTFIGTRDHVVFRGGSSFLRRLRLTLFAFLYRNAARAIDRFNLPPKSVIELSREIEI